VSATQLLAASYLLSASRRAAVASYCFGMTKPSARGIFQLVCLAYIWPSPSSSFFSSPLLVVGVLAALAEFILTRAPHTLSCCQHLCLAL
jgi:hypothetical protein